MKNWTKEAEFYRLSDKHMLENADPKEFSIYESVYGDTIYNRFAVRDWEFRLKVSIDNPFAKEESLYWIKCGGNRIGGVLIEPNVISRLFIIPPFADMFEILKLLKKLLIEWSDNSKNIYAYQISMEQASYFEMLGFWGDKSRRWMMRPTEDFEVVWDDNLLIKTPEKINAKEISRLIYESFSDNIDNYYFKKENGHAETFEDCVDLVEEYFESIDKNILMEASTLIYDKKENKLIGVCLISWVEGWPLVDTIGVDESYRGKHLASSMLKKALSVLNPEYEVLRLFVTVGNAAQSIYYKLGFVSGSEFKRFYLPSKISSEN